MQFWRELARNNHSFYKNLVACRQACLTAPAEREQIIVARSVVLKLGQLASRVLKGLAVVAMVGGLVLLLVRPRSDQLIVVAMTGVTTTVILVLRVILANSLCQTKASLLAQDSTLVHLKAAAEEAHLEMDAIWDEYNVNYRGYPPDWRWRREDVRDRDHHCCTKCRWPQGVERRKRNLHVHHCVPLARGGNNSLTNLTTLCHICHRDEEGTGHAGIRYQKRKR